MFSSGLLVKMRKKISKVFLGGRENLKTLSILNIFTHSLGM
jgi:hypothetical protein